MTSISRMYNFILANNEKKYFVDFIIPIFVRVFFHGKLVHKVDLYFKFSLCPGPL